jgi:predicted dehydrogenase
MAMNSAEAEAMASAARSADRLLCVAHNFLFSRSVGRAAPLLRDRAALQYVMGVQLSSHHRRLPSWHPDLPGGLLFDEIPHLLYLLQHWLGPLSLEDAGAVHRSPVGGPVVTEIRLRGPHGPGLVTVISGAPVSEWHVTVVSDLGVVDLDLFRDVAVRVGPDGSHKARDVLRTSARASFEHWRGFAASGTRMTAGRLFWGHDVLISRFLGAVAGSNALPVALDDALRVVAVTDDILAALDAG